MANIMKETDLKQELRNRYLTLMQKALKSGRIGLEHPRLKVDDFELIPGIPKNTAEIIPQWKNARNEL